ncbi:MAG: dienelactone hydrolase family protein [Bradyrhizobium sp.]|nr:dienelactone hydrolase family protein [Bradyrhizobium sp.]
MTDASAAEPIRFRDQTIAFDGIAGRNIDIPSASPLNYHQVISRPADMPNVIVDGKLFRPTSAGSKKLPLVMIVPGSLGVAPSHVAHAESLTRAGFATFVLDSFGARGVTSTVANQTQFSFAASAYDVLAAWKVLTALPEIDAAKVGAQGHSRGGSAVLTAATRRFADAVIGKDAGLQGVLAAYPWSGHQFLDPAVGATSVRVLMGDADEWCSPMQVQGHCQAIRLSGGEASMRLIAGAHHSFDRGTGIDDIANASVSPAAPTAYIADDGALIHPTRGESDPALVDRDLMVYALKAGYGRKGAKIGSRPGEAELFRDDMLAFWTRLFGKPS